MYTLYTQQEVHFFLDLFLLNRHFRLLYTYESNCMVCVLRDNLEELFFYANLRNENICEN